MHISYEGGILEDPWHEPAKEMFLWTTAPEDAPGEGEYVEIGFMGGEPVTVNGVAMKPVEIVSMLNMVGSKHGIGRVDIVENRYVGIKSRGVYETPGITILMNAHKAVESLTLDREVSHLKDSLSQKLATLIYNGYWFAPETKLLLKTIEETQGPVTGIAKLKLLKGNASIVGRKAPNSLYSSSLASFEEMESISPADAGGFININGLRLSMWSKTHESIAQGIPAKA
jgi:argininosuccinate synthase